MDGQYRRRRAIQGHHCRPEAPGQLGDQRANRRHRLVGASCGLDRLNHGATDHDTVGVRRDGRYVCFGLHTEADREGVRKLPLQCARPFGSACQIGGRRAGHTGHRFGLHAEADGERTPELALQCGRAFRRACQIGCRRAGYTGHRDVVDERRRHFPGLLDAMRVARRGDEGNEVEASRDRRLSEPRAFLGREIDDEESVGAAICRVIDELLLTVGENRIVIAEEQNRHVGTATDHAHRFEHVGERRSATQRSLRSTLNRRPIGGRIAEWHPELDDVGARIGRGHHQLHGRVQVRIPDAKVDHEGGAILISSVLERVSDAAHPGQPLSASFSMTVSRSLSPRPDRQTKMSASGPSSLASVGRYANAWLVSSAGMMPSVWHSC